MDTVDSADRLRRATARVALGLLALCSALPIASAIGRLTQGKVLLALAICCGTVACAGIAAGWWRHRHQRGAGLWSAALLVTSFATWIAEGNLLGMAPFLLAVTTLVSSVGIVAGIAVGAVTAVVLGTVYAASSAHPEGGIIANTLVVLFVVVAGALLAHLVDQLHDALEEVLAGQRLRQQAALEQMDTVLAHDRMQQAQHLHDELGQRLTLIGMGLEIAVRRRGRGPAADPDAPAWQEIDTTREAARDALAELRTLVRALSPDPQARTTDLDDALRRLEATFNSTGLQVHIRHHGTGGAHTIDSLAYRVIQEGLTNVVRHSDARRVWIDLDCDGDEIAVEVTDDGRGPADPGQTEDPDRAVDPGFGLRHLANRVELSGGHLETTRTEDGFTLSARYPRAHAAA